MRKVAAAACAAALFPALLQVSSRGAAAEVAALSVWANGTSVPSAGNAIIQGGVVMVPYQGLFEPLGIRATWRPDDRTLTLVGPAGDEIQLRSGDPYATVNGERRPISIPLVSVLGRVLIPVEWVFGALGDLTNYDPAGRTLTISPQITGVSWRRTDSGVDVTIEGTGPLHTTVSKLAGRVAVDITGAVPKSSEQLLDAQEPPLGAVHINQVASGTRITLDLIALADFRLLAQAPSRRMVIALTSSSVSGLPGRAPRFVQSPPPGRERSGTPQIASPPKPQPITDLAGSEQITDIAYQRLDRGGQLTIAAAGPLQVTQLALQHPDRAVLDIADAVFIPVRKSLDVNDDLVVQIRAAQFHTHPNVVRIVIELARPAPVTMRRAPEAGNLRVDIGEAIAAAPAPVTPPAARPRGPVVVAVDAGHGGSDSGAVGPTGIKEKDVALAIAQDLRRALLQAHLDVVMVRDSDTFVPLDDRVQIAMRAGATMLVSIHANASTDAAASGTQTFYSTPQSQSLAAAVLDEVTRALGLAGRGTSQARFKVLVDSDRIPAILVETAFITNPREEQMLRDPATQEAFAESLLRGIQRFLSSPPAPSP